MTAPAVSRGTPAAARPPRPVASLDDILLELVDIDDNVRDDVGELAELQASISELRLLSPVKVTAQPDGRYRLVYGQRRVLACRAIGRTKISAIVEPASDVDQVGARRSIEQLAENLQRKDLNPIEEAVALREVLDADPKLTQEALADQLAMSRPWVSNTLRLLGLVEPVQQAIRAGTISQSHGRAIAALPLKQQEEIARHAINDKVSSTQLEREIQWKADAAQQEERKAAKTEKWIPKAIAALEAAGTPKDVDVSVSGPYYDMDLEAVARAVKKAGWTKAHSGTTYYGGNRDASKCDCVSVGLSVGSRKAEVAKHCTDDRHRDRQVNADHRLEEKRREDLAAKRHELELRLAIALEAEPINPIVLRLIAARSYAELPDLLAFDGDLAEVRQIVVERLAGTADPTYSYGDRRARDDAAFDAVLDAFPASGAIAHQAPAKPAKGKKAAPA